MQELASLLTAFDSRPAVQAQPQFPVAVLPPSVRDFVEQSALATRVRPEMIAAPFLAFTGAVIGAQLRFEVSPGWFERPVLWIAMVATTGSGKSPAMRAARAPLDILQHSLFEEWRREFHTWAAQIAPTEPEPRPTHLFTTDPTLDALTHQLAHHNGITLLRDELYGIVRSLSRSGGDDRQKFLSLWSSESIAPIRITEHPVYVEDPVVAVVGGLQPLLLHKFRSREHDGFVERFLPLFVVNHQSYWQDSATGQPTPPDVKAIAGILDSFRHIANPEPDPRGAVVRMTPQAREVWSKWFNTNVDLQIAAHTELKGFYAKLPGHVARFALILHALWNTESPTSPVTGITIQHAIDLAEFFRIHIHNILPLLSSKPKLPPRLTMRQKIVKALTETTQPDGWMSRTDLIRALNSPPLAEFDFNMTILVGTNQIEDQIRTKPGSRKPRYEFRLPRPTRLEIDPK